MRVLRRGMSGEDVRRWQHFLRGEDGIFDGFADGVFGPATLEGTRLWQRRHGLVDDGIVGLMSFGVAQSLGFNPGFEDDDVSDAGPAWPAPPAFAPLDAAGREALFGTFSFEPAPTPGNQEGIKILGPWVQENIVTTHIPQLAHVTNARGGNIKLHKRAVAPFTRFFADVEAAGLLDRVLTFNGSWVPPFVRGSQTHLSNHAYGSAIDLNAEWNRLATVPALKGKAGLRAGARTDRQPARDLLGRALQAASGWDAL